MRSIRILLFIILASITGMAHADGDKLCRAYTTLPDYFSHPEAIEYIRTGAVEPGFEPKFSREFYAAILGRNDDLAKLLASRDKKKPFEVGILRASVQAGETQSVKLLLEAGAPPDLGGDEGGTPLLAAIHCDEPMMVGYLLAAGADVYWHNDTYGDAMTSAIAEDSIESTRMLLMGGYDPACATYVGPRREAETLANRLGDADMVLLLSSFRQIRGHLHPTPTCKLPPRDKTPLAEHGNFDHSEVGGISYWPPKY